NAATSRCVIARYPGAALQLMRKTLARRDDAMRAKLLRTNGPGREAVIEIDGHQYCVRDGFSWSAVREPKVGTHFDTEVSACVDTSWTWERMFAANPERRLGLQSDGGWSYLAFGRIDSIDPVRVDCGLLVEERAIFTHDPRVIGCFVGFRIS